MQPGNLGSFRALLLLARTRLLSWFVSVGFEEIRVLLVTWLGFRNWKIGTPLSFRKLSWFLVGGEGVWLEVLLATTDIVGGGAWLELPLDTTDTGGQANGRLQTTTATNAAQTLKYWVSSGLIGSNRIHFFSGSGLVWFNWVQSFIVSSLVWS